MKEANEKTNKDFRPKNVGFTNMTVARAQLLLNNKEFKFNSSFYKNLMKSKKTEPIRHLSNLSKVIEASFKNEKQSVDDLLPKLKFPLPNKLREIDNVIYENYKGNSQKFLSWNSKKMKNEVLGGGKIKDLRKELEDLNEIARTKYGINIPKSEPIPETDLKNSFFKLQPELLNNKILTYYDNNSLEKLEASSNYSLQKEGVGMDEVHERYNRNDNNNFQQVDMNEKNEDPSVPEFLLQNVFLASQEMKNFRIGKSQSIKPARNFKSQIGTRNPYKTKANFASTYAGKFMKSG